MIGKIGNKTKLLEKALDAAWLRNEVIANNIANVNTPGFKKSSVSFENALNSSMNELSISGKMTRPSHMPTGKNANMITNPEIVTEEHTSMRRDGNNVDIDVEMAELAKNSIKYNTLINQISREFRKLRSVINDGRK
ncbi:MAG: flagellar basal body rod protein FlgB [Bacillota bacterium]